MVLLFQNLVLLFKGLYFPLIEISSFFNLGDPFLAVVYFFSDIGIDLTKRSLEAVGVVVLYLIYEAEYAVMALNR